MIIDIFTLTQRLIVFERLSIRGKQTWGFVRAPLIGCWHSDHAPSSFLPPVFCVPPQSVVSLTYGVGLASERTLRSSRLLHFVFSHKNNLTSKETVKQRRHYGSEVGRRSW